MGELGARPAAVVIGAGIGGLATAAGLCAAGWDVKVCERAASIEPVGSGLGLAPNGLRALDVLGLGDEVRKHAIPQTMGMRRTNGRWLMRASSATIVSDRFGDPIILLPRSALIDVLLTAIPDGALSLSTAVSSVSASGQVVTSAGELRADLVVAADGASSAVRAALWPDEPGLKYAGFTTWRLLVPGTDETPAMAETWGRGSVFGVMPLADGRVYCYAAAPAERGDRARGDGGELADLVRRFGGWHEPIPTLLARATPGDVLRHDVAELARPLSSFHHGRVALLGDAAHPMTPNLGQGACQALEDAVVLARVMSASAGSAGGGPSPADSVEAALAAYSTARMDRTRYVVRWSHRAGAMTTWTSPVAVALRDGLAAVMGRLNPGAALRGLDEIYDWRPPALRFPALNAAPAKSTCPSVCECQNPLGHYDDSCTRPAARSSSGFLQAADGPGGGLR
jgi:2-polyprenyl-6-methoxyphenol hydroxylase-like FAD-dependent oxidoreductase